MTLDIAKFIRNSVLKQMKINHIEDISVQVFSNEDLSQNAPKVTEKLKAMNGETYLDDAQYFMFFSRKDQGFDREFIEKKLFKCVDSALGGQANKLNPSDLKTFSFDDEKPVQTEETPEDNADSTADVEKDNIDAISDIVGESVENPEANEKFVYIKITVK